MEWIEVDPLPQECTFCKEEECYNCDTAGKRWVLSCRDELQLRRKVLLKAMERIQKELDQIESSLSEQ